ncbi:MAG: hypothetical protein MZU79_00565 [Anaerotruncus sp.]|nr:hypothetical protein [Anaerotruncus sp.]
MRAFACSADRSTSTQARAVPTGAHHGRRYRDGAIGARRVAPRPRDRPREGPARPLLVGSRADPRDAASLPRRGAARARPQLREDDAEAIREELGDFAAPRLAVRDRGGTRRDHARGDGRADRSEDGVALFVPAPLRPRAARAVEQLKRKEGRRGTLDGLPPSFASTCRMACTASRNAAGRGFDWPDTAGPIAKVREEPRGRGGTARRGGGRPRRRGRRPAVLGGQCRGRCCRQGLAGARPANSASSANVSRPSRRSPPSEGSSCTWWGWRRLMRCGTR